jgi:hypothetical protein
MGGVDRQLTTAPHGHILTNAGVWSPDSAWLAFDVRSDPGGAVFDGASIHAVHVCTGRVRALYRTAADGGNVGVVMFAPARGGTRKLEVMPKALNPRNPEPFGPNRSP